MMVIECGVCVMVICDDGDDGDVVWCVESKCVMKKWFK